uniref:TATA binding protein of transcription factor IID n=1 Tax=Amorphochlora amoebiformis TaxID=1561963 RepID=A0A0H5BII7_9EUKA|nr:TATA binding protein of transcription factor IID [Amorphochlora amoebiformis]
MTRETNSVLRKKFNDIIKIKPNIQNVVCTVDLNTVLDLKKIALKAKNTEFNPKKFHALVIRSREPKATALIFKSGKMVCTGTKTENEAKEATLKFLKVIKQAGFSSAKIKVSIQKKNFEVRNVVATCDFKKSIKLETVMFAYRNQCMYEPEIFPGLIFRPEKSKIVAIMFLTGKVVITGYINGIGAKSFDDMWRVYNFLIKIFLDLNVLY